MKYRFLLIILISISSVGILLAQNFNIYRNDTVEFSKRYINGNSYQKDFLLFMDMLDKTHPAFSDQSCPPFDIEAKISEGYLLTNSCGSPADLSIYMQEILATIGDGHTSLLLNHSQGSIFPFILHFEGEEVYLKAISKEFEAALNKRVLSINNMPVKEVVYSFKRYLPSDNEQYFLTKVAGFMQFVSSWNIRSSVVESLDIAFDDGTSIELNPIRGNVNMAYSTAYNGFKGVRKVTKEPFIYTIVDDICYQQFNACFDKNTLREQYISNPNITKDQSERALSKFMTFEDFLDKMFSEVYSKNIKTLVVDVRDNSGGNSSLGDMLLSYIKPSDSIDHFSSIIRFSALWEQQYPQFAQRVKVSFQDSNIEYRQGDILSLHKLSDILNATKGSTDKQSIASKKRTFDGKVVFVQNENTYSSAGMLITTARDNGIGIVIGTKSSYSPSHYGDLLYWSLPNTNIQGFISHKEFNRPNTSKSNEKELIPDVMIDTKLNDLIRGQDMCWAWILDNK